MVGGLAPSPAAPQPRSLADWEGRAGGPVWDTLLGCEAGLSPASVGFQPITPRLALPPPSGGCWGT